ncbi:MAG: geranylgeranylglyceryl/heptaprenylglyceryl phosphate synthase [Candidatus Micrarchaeota archaeon]
MGKTQKYILESLESKGALLAALIDPLDYPGLDGAINAGVAAAQAGADYVLVGGSTGVGGELLDTVVKEIKKEISVPLVLFPGNVTTVSKYADALYFMSMLNSRNPYWISGAQTLAAPIVAHYKVEPLSVGYMVVEPGGTVGWVGDANKIPRSKPSLAAAMALSAQFMGFHFVLSDSGSNPADGPLPAEMAKAISSAVSIPYIIGGGVRNAAQAKTLVKAGADILQVGTALESGSDVKKTVGALAEAIHSAGKGRKKEFSI